MAEEEPWLSLTEAAQATGLDREAIRSRARRGLVPSRKNNRGGLLVQIPVGLMAESDHAMTGPLTDLVTNLTAEVADLRVDLARAEAEVNAAKAVAEARVNAAIAEAKAVRELADRLTAELVELRQPWWRRWL